METGAQPRALDWWERADANPGDPQGASAIAIVRRGISLSLQVFAAYYRISPCPTRLRGSDRINWRPEPQSINYLYLYRNTYLTKVRTRLYCTLAYKIR